MSLRPRAESRRETPVGDAGRALVSHQGPLVHVDHSRRVAPAPTGGCLWSSQCRHVVNVFVATKHGIIHAGGATYHYYRLQGGTTNMHDFGTFKGHLQTFMNDQNAGYAFGLTPKYVNGGRVWTWIFHTIATRDGSNSTFDEGTMNKYIEATKSAKRYEVIFLGNDPKGTDIEKAMEIGNWSHELNHVMKD